MSAIQPHVGVGPLWPRAAEAPVSDVERLLADNQVGGVLDTASLVRDLFLSAPGDPAAVGRMLQEAAARLGPLDQVRLEADAAGSGTIGDLVGGLRGGVRSLTDNVVDVLTRSVVPLSPELARGIDGAAIDLGLARYDPGSAQMLRPAQQGVGEAIERTPGQVLPLGARQTLADVRPREEPVKPDGSVVERSAAIGRNEATWTVDSLGRPIRAEATLREVFVDLDRSAAEQRAQGDAADRGVEGDHGGHIIGHRFVKDQGLDNLFPQNGDFNISAYKTLENEMADWVETGAEVRVAVDLLGGGDRPERVRVVYEVVDPASGDVVYDNNVLFQNAADQTFDRTPSSDMKDILAG